MLDNATLEVSLNSYKRMRRMQRIMGAITELLAATKDGNEKASDDATKCMSLASDENDLEFYAKGCALEAKIDKELFDAVLNASREFVDYFITDWNDWSEYEH